MKARGKREAQRNASPLVTKIILKRALKVRNINRNYSALSELHRHFAHLPGATRLTLFGACPWLSYSAPLALERRPYSALALERRPFRAFGAGSVAHSAPLALEASPIFRVFGAGIDLGQSRELAAQLIRKLGEDQLHGQTYTATPSSQLG
jgi:hypothetical protein